ncbi:MAG: tRNA (adenosine(37)-N6)-threonylcarbamoyltransferase complex dimerization subunit type 1 TsaB [Gammaproteobacteria bacterium]|nr:tRNA (adenosine(37)-N6)-threonylcarbamoyltransferase complex dimerization subunit type 1 TsaB [Gammaproteobacteria bacterium]
MKLLGIETASDACSAALMLGGETLQRFEIAPRRHADLILPMVDQLLAEAGISASTLDAIAFGRGPGAFTGVRLAAGVTQGIAYGLDLPVVPVSSLATLAQGVDADQVWAGFDARLGEVYWGAYRRSSAGLMEAVIDEVVCAPEAISDGGLTEATGIGHAWLTYEQPLRQKLGSRITRILPDQLPRAADLLRLAEALVAGGELVTAAEAQPIYLRTPSWR